MIIKKSLSKGTMVWKGVDEDKYHDWEMRCDDALDEELPLPVRPLPTAVFEVEEMNQLVCEWLRGPVGQPGMPGPKGDMGAPGKDAK